MNYVDLLEQYEDDPVMKAEVLKALDYMVKYIHEHGYYISDFDPSKIMLQNGKLTPKSFQSLLRQMETDPRGKNINILQEAKIGLMAFNNMKLDGNMNQEHFNFIRDNLSKFNQNGFIPPLIYEYYEEIFLRNMIDYLNDYLNRKHLEELEDKGNSNAIRKSLATAAGRAMAGNGRQFVSTNNEDAAYVSILFIPSLLTLLYLIGLFVYTFFIK